MTQTDIADSPLDRAREALRRRAWQQAYDLFAEADASESLSAEDLADLAEAAWAIGRDIECIRARERAYTAFAERKDTRRAAQQALDLFADHIMKNDMAVAGGWYSTAQRLLADQPECAEHGLLVYIEAFFQMSMGKFDRVADLARDMSEIGTRFGDRDLQTLALLLRSDVHVSRGRVSDAVPLLDEAMAAAISGELRPSTSRNVYCTTVGTCQQLADFRRAGEWTEATERCNVRESIVPLGGDCRVHRAGILRVRGAWDEAEAEARSACDQLFGGNHNVEMARAMYEIGEIQMRRGDLVTAEDSFQQAHSGGGVAQPGIALLRLAQGRPEDAFSSIKNALTYQTGDRLTRARMLPAQVEIAIVVGDLDTARACAEELEAIANDYQTAGMEASAACVRGSLHLAEGSPSEAVTSLRRGWQLWQEVEVPYEAARARMLLAAAYGAQGDHESARSELHAAKSVFDRLGAAPDALRAAELLEEYAPVSAAPLAEGVRATRTFMFTDIIKSTNLIEAIGDEAWEALLKWHDQTMRSLLAAHSGEEVKHGGDGFFFTFTDADSAIDCAVNIQRTLAEHRTAHGFAPQVRIGLHAAEATRRGRDYSGKGIHEAARIGALGNGGEILVSQQTLAGASGGFATSEARTVSLKGISESVQIVAVDWR